MKKTAVFMFDSNVDMIFIPFSPFAESDRMEIRIQIKNEGVSGYINLKVYMDEEKESSIIYSKEDVFIEENEFYFTKIFQNLSGKAGNHKIIIRLNCSQKSQDAIINKVYSETKFEVLKCSENVLEGGFLVIGPPDNHPTCDNFTQKTKSLTDEQWEQLIDSYNEIGLKLLIIVSTQQLYDVHDSKSIRAHYESKLFPKSNITAKDPINAILNRADINGQKVVIGLDTLLNWGKRDYDNVYRLMEELYSRYKKHNSFYGWYDTRETGISYDSDPNFDWGWTIERFAKVREKADELSPVKAVVFSPNTFFHNKEGITQPGISAEFLKLVKEGKLGINIIVPQDTIGQRRAFRNTYLEMLLNTQEIHSIKHVIKHFSALCNACKDSETHLWANCESFIFGKEGYLVPRCIEKDGFDGEKGFVQQITALRPYVEKVITFMLNGFYCKPDFVPNIGGEIANDMYVKYSNYILNPDIRYKNLALNKKYQLSTLPVRNFPDSNYSATDGVLYGGESFNTDINKTFAYKLEAYEKINVSMVIDLCENNQIDKFRYAEHWDKTYFSPDIVEVYFSNDNKNYQFAGLGEKYLNGWMDILSNKKMNDSRYIKVNFIKQNKSEKYTWMFIDEFEVLKKY